RPHVVLPPASVDEGLKDVTSVNEKETKAETRHEIRSPIVGTFYLAPGPDADPYVQVGDIVTKGSVLCIVEAMKLMNEIESDTEGRIVKILVENGKPVEFNQPLFLIQPN
ncbi:MAG TPA: acetyl-CoA carboxylase biotin carboxyl carrier protein, partial [Ignavibacteriales bacterium]|nr:acetyl-CoA carboxylase biotin carboxyl carrier protein [Ignavibacteriales bacterium]